MPQLHTYRRYEFTADLWGFTETTDGEGGNVSRHFLKRAITLHLVQDEFGSVTCKFKDSEADMRPGDRLYRLRDKDGVEVYPGGIWTMRTFMPNINVYGQREGFNGSADLTHGELAN